MIKQLLQRTKKKLFLPCSSEVYAGLHGPNKSADAVYLPAYDRLFMLLKHFYLNGLRGDIFEFGVFQGYTAHLLASCMNRFQLKSAALHLFDSFEGLPSASEVDQLGYESQNKIWQSGMLKTTAGVEKLIESTLGHMLGKQRLHVVKGFFDETLPPYLGALESPRALLVHLDCDLYSSSKCVLQALFKYGLIQDGTVLICDDWMTSMGNPNLGQRRAVKEILEEFPSWEFEPYFNYGMGSQVFVIHDTSLTSGRRFEVS